MNGCKVKLVVSDIDGTLLNAKGELPPNFYSLYERMRKHGIKFAPASGRQIFNIKSKFPDIEDELYFIAENGAYVTHKKETLLELSIPHAKIKGLRETAIKIPNTYMVLSGKKHAYIEASDPVFLARLRSYSGHLLETDDISKIDNDTFFKFTLCDLDNPLKNSLKHFEKFKSEFTVQTSGTKWLDLTNKTACKSEAVKLIQKQIGASPQETIVFGDYLNDLQMIKNCPNSYAMANAIAEVKAAAKNSAPSNEDFGVAKILDEILPL